MATRPEMSWIESRKQWRKRINIGGRSKDVYGNTKQEVRNQIKDLQAQVEAGLVLNDATTFFQYSTSWLPTRLAGLGASAKTDYTNALNNHIAPVLQDMVLRDIKPSHIAQVMAKCADKSNRLQSCILGTMRQMFNAAEADGLILKNPTLNIKAGGAKAKEKTPLTRQQQTALVEAAEGSPLYLFVLLCLYAGLRREEVLGLLWENIHLGNVPYLDVRNTLTYAGCPSGNLSDSLKSPAARRSIPLPPILATALKLAQQTADKRLVIPAAKSDNGLPDASYKRYWKAVTDKVDFHVHPHLLRHTYITELCAAGIDIKKVQYLAGHSNPQMTLKVYAHVVNNRPEELISAVEGAFSTPQLGVKLGVKKRLRLVKAKG